MSLQAGDKLGPFEIVATIGAGGMGEVYRARDPRMGRDVAIKVSTDAFNERFDREVRAVAALNHPNICHLYDVGPNYLVMELVEGESPIGPLPKEEAVRIAQQIADALSEAHEKGIVHRDLKPSNIKVTPDGTVKVLDFGLATQNRDREGTDITATLTQAGSLLGTPAYMSPEQARGKTVDRRADIWAFGVIFHELLTGKRLHQGETITDVLASVVKEDPSWTEIPADLQPLLKACLEKDPKHRLHDIADAWRLVTVGPAISVAPAILSPVKRYFKYAAYTLAAAILAFAGHMLWRHVNEETRILRFHIAPPDKSNFAIVPPALSPDGRRIAFIVLQEGKTTLWVHDLDALAARALPGTEEASFPFWSPDSRFLGFFANGKVKKIDVTGGPALTLCDIAGPARGGSWNKDDVILFSTTRGTVMRVSAAGGTATPATQLEGREDSHRFPWFLPDGRHFLYNTGGEGENDGVFLGELDSKNHRRLLTAASNAAYAPPGFLVYSRERTLLAQPFDAGAAKTTGEPVPIAEQVDYNPANLQTQFSVSQNGVLAYTSGAAGGNTELRWIERSGKPAGVLGAPGFYEWVALSPDEKTIAFDRRDPQTGFDLWIRDLTRGTESRLTFDAKSNRFPVWSPDGSQLAFLSERTGAGDIFRKSISGTLPQEPLDQDPRRKRAGDWSRDGRYLIEEIPSDPKTKGDIWILPLEPSGGAHKAVPYLHSDFNEGEGRVSPNSRWIAYNSDETKRSEVYVQSFPQPGGKWQISTGGGRLPRWSRDGKELFFISADQKMMAVSIDPGPNLHPGIPKALFDVHLPPNPGYDVARDGRFIIPMVEERSGVVPITVVVNWPLK